MTSLRSASALAIGMAFASQTFAATTIPFWHSMEGELGKEVESLAQRFNKTHPDYQITPVYKGNYEQSLAAGIAAFRTGNAPAILQVYEVGTATMMASKAIKPGTACRWQLKTTALTAPTPFWNSTSRSRLNISPCCRI